MTSQIVTRITLSLLEEAARVKRLLEYYDKMIARKVPEEFAGEAIWNAYIYDYELPDNDDENVE